LNCSKERKLKIKSPEKPLAIPQFEKPFPFKKRQEQKKKKKEKDLTPSLFPSFLSSSLLKKRKGASRHSSKSSLKSQPFYRRYKPILPTSLNYIDLNRPEAIHLGDLMRFLVRIDPNRSVI